MSDLREKTPGEILTDASVAEFISAMGLSIAQAQTELDRNSIAQVGEYLKPQKGLEGKSLLQLGLSPPFYHYQHADLNVSLQLTMKVGETQAFGIGGSVKFGLDSGGKGAASGAARMAEVTRNDSWPRTSGRALSRDDPAPWHGRGRGAAPA